MTFIFAHPARPRPRYVAVHTHTCMIVAFRWVFSPLSSLTEATNAKTTVVNLNHARIFLSIESGVFFLLFISFCWSNSATIANVYELPQFHFVAFICMTSCRLRQNPERDQTLTMRMEQKQAVHQITIFSKQRIRSFDAIEWRTPFYPLHLVYGRLSKSDLFAAVHIARDAKNFAYIQLLFHTITRPCIGVCKTICQWNALECRPVSYERKTIARDRQQTMRRGISSLVLRDGQTNWFAWVWVRPHTHSQVLHKP